MIKEEKNAVIEYLSRFDVDVFGIADFSKYDKEVVDLPDDVRSLYPFAISFGMVLSRGVLETVRKGPNPLYLHHYRQANSRLDRIAYLLSREIERAGYRSLPLGASQVVDWRNQKAHLSHKHVGVLAGLGWIGRNNLLVHPSFGSHLRYNTVLTDMPLEASVPLDEGCGNCRACAEVCPAGAIKDDPVQFDHMGCYHMITELKNKRNIGHHICGICVEACKGVR
ncbi:MAG TPA: reductive dehalogenase domain-containing protein [Syntrophorhabdaceae bacterium]|jgi:epoxyqueuosine reductase QueG